jgi:hypothetical protein
MLNLNTLKQNRDAGSEGWGAVFERHFVDYANSAAI